MSSRRARTSMPSTSPEPASIGMRPRSVRMSVVLPPPYGPSMPAEPTETSALQRAVLLGQSGAVPQQMPEVPRRRRERVRAATAVPRLTLLERVTSPTDGFTKYLFRGIGPEPFEAVCIPLLHRPGDEKYIVCV